ncbi:alpha-amylase family glycosyl hydrolase [Salinispira pacifica]|uniref:Trehalose synthase n=1 Tax=Salinispira pacifica TaxID=1307761 RepID=V5WKD5_9SPIO|nr:alpha-amylase family glycosyl hydrolase [Salinispira pacifica]AHC16292.1 Trehalose synthase [Salinispira pacifica]
MGAENISFTDYETMWRNVYEGVVPDGRWKQECRETWELLQASGAPGRVVRKTDQASSLPATHPWYEDLVVYALYAQHFNENISGIISRLDYLAELGVNCLWLLPVLSSPMKDEGFDISDYRSIRKNLFQEGLDELKRREIFDEFIRKAAERGIAIIFDVAVNHVSSQHDWFQNALKAEDNPYRDYFIWSEDNRGYSQARIIFKGMLDSNWTYSPAADKYYFHRFYPHQPDLNYRNPRVLSEIIRVFSYWIQRGIRGFRLDAAPYLWKEEGTNCENLGKTHDIIKILRKSVELIQEDVLLLAEACQPPREVVSYFGDNDECQAAYHFPLMPRMYRSILQESAEPIVDVMKPGVTPAISRENQWFTFLRLHDELTLEMVSPEEREFLHGKLCKRPEWDFRNGEGISARLAELFDTPREVLFAHLLLLGMSGNPVIYYGDEVLEGNNVEFARYQQEHTGFVDSRNLVRGPLNWNRIDGRLADGSSDEAWHYRNMAAAIHCRLSHPQISNAAGEEREVINDSRGSAIGLKLIKEDGFELYYNLSQSRELSIELPASHRPILSWSGLRENDLESEVNPHDPEAGTVPSGDPKEASRIQLPPRGVLWVSV